MKAKAQSWQAGLWVSNPDHEAGPGLERAGAETGGALPSSCPGQCGGGGRGVGWPWPRDGRWCPAEPTKALRVRSSTSSQATGWTAAQRLATVVNDERFVSGRRQV